jgi:methionyl-tRNA formyltransferase
VHVDRRGGKVISMKDERTDDSVLFLGKTADPNVLKALDFCRLNFSDVTACLGSWGDELPDLTKEWEGDYIISYLSRWVVPEQVLSRARIAAFNFHPGPPEYPGIGCTNFALYENAEQYGVTCHHMAPRVDTGGIIAVSRFPVFPADDVASLLVRTHNYQLILFYDVVGRLVAEGTLPTLHEEWTRRPLTRKELDALCEITLDMSEVEVHRRIRATAFGEWRPFLEHHGMRFELKK